MMSARDGIKDKSVKESDLIVLLNHICGTGLATSNKRHKRHTRPETNKII